MRIPIARIEGKRKLSQNRSAEDRQGVVDGLMSSDRENHRIMAGLIPR